MKQYEIDYLYACAEGKAGPLSEERIAELRGRISEHRDKDGAERRITSLIVESVEKGPKGSVVRFTTKPETPPESGDSTEATRLLSEILENEGK